MQFLPQPNSCMSGQVDRMKQKLGSGRHVGQTRDINEDSVVMEVSVQSIIGAHCGMKRQINNQHLLDLANCLPPPPKKKRLINESVYCWFVWVRPGRNVLWEGIMEQRLKNSVRHFSVLVNCCKVAINNEQELKWLKPIAVRLQITYLILNLGTG